MINPKFIYLEWVDAHVNPGWMSKDQAELWADGTGWYISEAGWLIKETKEYIAIAQGMKPQNDIEEAQFVNLHKIPKTWIRKRIDLTKNIKKSS